MIDQIEVAWVFRLIWMLFGHWYSRRDSLVKARQEAAVAKAREEERAKCRRQLFILLGCGAAVFLIWIFLESFQSAARA